MQKKAPEWLLNLLRAHYQDRILTHNQVRRVLFPILLTITALCVTASALLAYSAISNVGSPATELAISFSLSVFFGILLLNSRKRPILVAGLLISCLLSAAFYSLYCSGFITPQPLLSVAVCILAGSVLISRFAGTFLILICTTYILLLSNYQIGRPENIPVHWSNTDTMWADSILFLVTFGCIHLLTNIYSSENKRSLRRAVAIEILTQTEVDRLIRDRFSHPNSKFQQELISFRRKVGDTFHDVVNPLTGTALALEDIINRDDLTRDEVVEAIRSSAKSVQMTSTLINSLREAFNNTDEPSEWFSPKHVLEELRCGLVYALRSEGTELTISGPSGILIYGSETSFGRICSNLISNSRDAYRNQESAGAKHIRITISDNEKEVTITFSDWAGGLPNHVLPHIFTRHFTTKQSWGSGLGLAIVKRYLREDFKGQIFCKTKNRSTEFTIVLEKRGLNVLRVSSATSKSAPKSSRSQSKP